MVRQPFDMFAQQVRIGAFDGLDDPRVQGFSPFLGSVP